MEKLSNEKVAKVLSDTREMLLSVTQERDKLAAENSRLKVRSECEKLASVMHSKGLELDVEYETLVERLEKQASDGRLPVVQEAVDMVAPNMGLTSQLTSDDGVSGAGASQLEGFILGSVG